VRHLEALLARELKRAARHRASCFLELFAGSARVSRSLRAEGFAAVSLDFKNGADENHLSHAFIQRILGWITSGVVLGVFIHSPPSDWPDSMRARADVTVSRVLDACVRLSIPGLCEGRLTHVPGGSFSQGHSCQFGVRWRRTIDITRWNAPSAACLKCKCMDFNMCSRTNRPHITAVGHAPGGRTWHSLAAELPRRFARCVAAVLIASVESLRGRRLSELMLG
jgi:hypothetical protein